VSTAATGGYVHDALFYGSDDELLAAAVPFVRAGLDAGDNVVLVCAERNTALLTEALGRDPRIGSLPRAEVYHRVPAAIAAYRWMMREEMNAGARRVRVLGEVDFGAGPADWAEWTRFEAVVNRALAPYPLWGVCMYDTRRLPRQVLEDAKLTHPNLSTRTSRARNPDYIDPGEFLRRFAPEWPDPLEASQPALHIDDAVDLRLLRHNVTAAFAGSPWSPDAVDGFVVAVNEMATNARIYGRAPVRVRLWSTAGRALCAVTDQGSGFDDPYVGYVLAESEDLSRGGMGWWLARQLCDEVHATTASEGFTVRVAVNRRD
jgi:anti-sigma regulatory factor (Ser/Thr protein kinase)